MDLDTFVIVGKIVPMLRHIMKAYTPGNAGPGNDNKVASRTPIEFGPHNKWQPLSKDGAKLRYVFPAHSAKWLIIIIIWLLHNLVEASFDLFRYRLLGDQLRPWELHPLVS